MPRSHADYVPGVSSFDEFLTEHRDGANTIRLDAADKSVVVLLHEVPFADVIRAAFRAEDQKAVAPGPVIHVPRVATG